MQHGQPFNNQGYPGMGQQRPPGPMPGMGQGGGPGPGPMPTKPTMPNMSMYPRRAGPYPNPSQYMAQKRAPMHYPNGAQVDVSIVWPLHWTYTLNKDSGIFCWQLWCSWCSVHCGIKQHLLTHLAEILGVCKQVLNVYIFCRVIFYHLCHKEDECSNTVFELRNIEWIMLQGFFLSIFLSRLNHVN